MPQNNNIMPDQSRPGQTTTALSIEVQGESDKCATGLKNLSKEEITIGHWNVQSLYAVGKLQELTNELKNYRWQVIDLSEVRWMSTGHLCTTEGLSL